MSVIPLVPSIVPPLETHLPGGALLTHEPDGPDLDIHLSVDVAPSDA